MKLKMETIYAIGYKKQTHDTWSTAVGTVNYDKAIVEKDLAYCISVGANHMEYTLLRIDSHGIDNITHIKSGKLPSPGRSVS